MNDHVRMARVWISAARQANFASWRRQCLEYAASRRARFYDEIREARKPIDLAGQLDMFT